MAELSQNDLMYRPGLMKGQRILITGGGTGLGKVMAEACLILGADVYICGRRGGVVEATAKELNDAHPTAEGAGKCVGVACDIRVPEAIADMIETVWADGGALTGLVNNAAGNFISRTEDLSVKGFEAKPGPCDDGARNLVAYIGVLRGATLALRWGPEAGQTLVRRTDNAGHTPLAPADAVGGDVRQASMVSSQPSAPLGGTWVWELRSIDAEGDERTEREEWHLAENPDGVSGYYDRTVARVRGDGTSFACNGQPRYETTTRYNVTGQRFGDKLTLTETDYKAPRSPCDNALRRLDTYQGHVADADSLILSWGPGNQLLRRVKK